MAKVILVVSALLLLLQVNQINTTYAEDQILPDELLELAQKHGYASVVDFYERPGPVDQSYVYGYLEGPKEDSAAFWVKKLGENQGKKLEYYPIKCVLLIMAREKGGGAVKLVDKIEWWNPPARLSIYKDRSITLNEFRHVKNPKKKGNKGVKLTHNAIASEYDGVRTIFYNYKGEWFYRIWH